MVKRKNINPKKWGVIRCINDKFRHLAYRVGRKIYAWSRGDVTTSPEVNGEYFLLNTLVESLDGQKAILVDVGAHMGKWSDFALQILRNRTIPFELHIFEPTSSSFKKLNAKFCQNNIFLNQLAVSNSDQMVEIFIDGDDYGTNSLYKNELTNRGVELVAAVTLDSYFPFGQKIDFLKIDTEGHDFLVIDGAANLFASGCIGVCQFEYNHRWTFSRIFLKDIFDWVKDKNYLVCKMNKNFISIYSEWHPEMERLFEANYLLVKSDHPILLQLGRNIKYDESNVPIQIY